MPISHDRKILNDRRKSIAIARSIVFTVPVSIKRLIFLFKQLYSLLDIFIKDDLLCVNDLAEGERKNGRETMEENEINKLRRN